MWFVFTFVKTKGKSVTETIVIGKVGIILFYLLVDSPPK